MKDRADYDALLNGLLERLAAFSGSAPSAGGGWRYKLLASWCLMHLIRPAVRPPMAVWRYYAECLSEGDGQPLQRLALGALKRLLSGADPTSPGDMDVSGLLCSKAFLHPFLLALAYNHQKQATEGGLAGGQQWSLGVKEVLHDSGRGDTRELVRTMCAAVVFVWAATRRVLVVRLECSLVGLFDYDAPRQQRRDACFFVFVVSYVRLMIALTLSHERRCANVPARLTFHFLRTYQPTSQSSFLYAPDPPSVTVYAYGSLRS